jgi:hypothetical protein
MAFKKMKKIKLEAGNVKQKTSSAEEIQRG